MNKPLVSIIIPTYNRGHLIGETLESVIGQTYQNWECIVVDDRSNDYTEELLEFYCLLDSRIVFYKRPELKIKGASSCRNYGIQLSKGKFIQFLDSDDLLHPEKLKKQLKYVREGVILTSKWGYFSGRDLFERFKYQQKSYRDFKKPMKLLYCFGKYNEFLPLHSYLIPKGILEKTGKWKEDLGNNDDAEYISRVLRNTKRIKSVSDALVFYRVEGKSTLSGFGKLENAESALESLRYIERNLIDYPQVQKKYLGNLTIKVGERIKTVYPELYLKNKDLLSL